MCRLQHPYVFHLTAPAASKKQLSHHSKVNALLVHLKEGERVLRHQRLAVTSLPLSSAQAGVSGCCEEQAHIVKEHIVKDGINKYLMRSGYQVQRRFCPWLPAGVHVGAF